MQTKEEPSGSATKAKEGENFEAEPRFWGDMVPILGNLPANDLSRIPFLAMCSYYKEQREVNA